MRPLVGHLGSEHHAEVRGVREGKAHVGDPQRPEALTRPARPAEELAHAPGHLREAALGHRGEQRLAVGEVPVGRSLGHPRAARHLAKAEALPAFPGHEGRRYVNEGVAQPSGRRGLHARATGHRVLSVGELDSPALTLLAF